VSAAVRIHGRSVIGALRLRQRILPPWRAPSRAGAAHRSTRSRMAGWSYSLSRYGSASTITSFLFCAITCNYHRQPQDPNHKFRHQDPAGGRLPAHPCMQGQPSPRRTSLFSELVPSGHTRPTKEEVHLHEAREALRKLGGGLLGGDMDEGERHPAASWDFQWLQPNCWSPLKG